MEKKNQVSEWKPYETAEEHNAAIRRSDENWDKYAMPILENPVFGGMTVILVLGGVLGVAMGAVLLLGNLAAQGMMP